MSIYMLAAVEAMVGLMSESATLSTNGQLSTPRDILVCQLFAAASPTLYYHFEPKFYANFRQSEEF